MDRRLSSPVLPVLTLALLCLLAPSPSLLAQKEVTASAGTPQQAPTSPQPATVPDSTVAAGDAAHSGAVLFIENVGQFDEGARFQARGAAGGTVWLSEDAIWLTILEPAKPDDAGAPIDPERLHVQPADEPRRGANIKLSFVGANPEPVLEPFDRLNTPVSYFLGNDPEQWQPAVPVWGGVRYVDLYPGVSLEITGEAGQMVPRLTTQLGADLGAVRLRIEGADGVVLEGDTLRLTTAVGNRLWPLLRAEGTLAQPAVQPGIAFAFQVISPLAPTETNRPAAIGRAPAGTDGAEDLLYGGFLGGSSEERGTAIALDTDGAAYVTGRTRSSNLPTTPGSFDPDYNDDYDTYIAKVSSSGSDLIYATYLGGAGNDQGYGIAVDGSGAAYVAGMTGSPDFPATPGAFDTSLNGTSFDAFIAKLSPDGTALEYATYLGGSADEGRSYGYDGGIAVDGSGAAYVASTTLSNDFPTTEGTFDTSYAGGESGDAFVTKLNPAGSALVYSTYLGGAGSDNANAIAIDGSGAAYVTGYSASSDFPTTAGAFDTSPNGDADAIITKLNSDGSALVYSTYLGGGSADYASGIAIDGCRAAYVTGYCGSSDFPTTTGAFDTSYNGGFDVIITKLNSGGSTLVYSTFLGGSSADFGDAIAVDWSGAAHMTGTIWSTDFPTTPDGFDISQNGNRDSILSKLDASGSALIYSTYLGDSDDDYGTGIAVDATGDAHITGYTYPGAPPFFPSTPDSFSPGPRGGYDAYVVKLATGGETGYSVSGHVIDAIGGDLEGVMISTGVYCAVTDASGNYVFSKLPVGTHTLTPALACYSFEPVTRIVDVPPDVIGQDFLGTYQCSKVYLPLVLRGY